MDEELPWDTEGMGTGFVNNNIAGPTHVALVSAEGVRFRVSLAAAGLSSVVRQMLEDLWAGASEAERAALCRGSAKDNDDEDDNMFDTFGEMLEVPLPAVDADTLSRVVEYCEHHRDTDPRELQEEDRPLQTLDVDEDGQRCEARLSVGTAPRRTTNIMQWDYEFCGSGGDGRLVARLLAAANYLDVAPLVALTLKMVANEVKQYSVAELRSRHGIVDDLTEEERGELFAYENWMEYP